MYCYVEGVNFDATIYDTQDISTIRGGSIILEELPGDMALALRPFAPIQLSHGGAKALFQLGSGSEEEIRQTVRDVLSNEKWSHMSVVHGVSADKVEAKRQAKIMQYQSWTVPNPGGAGDVPCDIDRTRPGMVEVKDPDGGKRLVSASVNARRDAGKRDRPRFIRKARLRAPQSFSEMLQNPPSWVPDQIRSKLAVIAADGIGGGKIAQHVGDDALFSRQIEEMRSDLANAMCDWALDPHAGAHVPDDGIEVMRFDTLLWGGDDMLFAMPAWLVMPFLSLFFRVTEMAQFKPEGGESRTLYHRLSCVIANAKTPIRQMRGLALSGEYALKAGIQNADLEKSGAFTIDVFESSALPFEDLLSFRRAQYGSGYQNGADLFRSDEVTKLMRCFDGITADEDGLISPTQVHRILEEARLAGHTVLSEGAEGVARSAVDEYNARVQGDGPGRLDELPKAMSSHPRKLALTLAQIAQLRPYVEPNQEGGA